MCVNHVQKGSLIYVIRCAVTVAVKGGRKNLWKRKKISIYTKITATNIFVNISGQKTFSLNTQRSL